jgi:hypothetical protein
VLLAVSLGTNAFLAHRLLRPQSAAAEMVSVGQQLPPVGVTTLDGRRELIRYAEQRQPTVLYVFSPPCHFGAANLESINYLFQTRGAAYLQGALAKSVRRETWRCRGFLLNGVSNGKESWT